METPTNDDALGGRLALRKPADLDGDQRALYDQLQRDLIPWAHKSGFKADTADGRLLGPFNPLLVSPKLGTAFVDYLAAERDGTSLSATVREVIILTVGAVWKSAYELYAHTAVAKQAGLDPMTVDALALGRPPTSLSADQRAAHDFARQLAADRRVEEPVYQAAVDCLGERGVTDLIHLAGLYMATSAMLNAFAVPVPA